ncbi:AMP-binding protein [Nocardioides sp. dk4132]|uniref:class I adenylate-forming enzyme family protein n=1 Tax=unclassified Nocardioides TaxID=2615069 RepID=UPI0012980AAC|nr:MULTISPECIES: AMP-binding protein [unclassified Nocardioides]MQW74464.1 AMP-binding protein [Nocardioides sp. dk4132]QGA06397.1 AMP-binding protein [Nocardioides sp. dk884]
MSSSDAVQDVDGSAGHAGPGVRDLSDLVVLAAAESPDKLAIVEASGRSVTWSQLADDVARVATGLGSLGVVGGLRVVLALGNSIEMVAGYLGVLRAQAVAVPVNPGSTPAELTRFLAESGARLVICDPESAPAVRAALADLPVAPRVVLVGADPEPGELAWERLRTAPARAVLPLQDPEKLACLLWTSGASGRPRAAMLTHRALLANIEQAAGVEPPMIHGDDVVLGVLPLFHVYGLNAVLGAVLRHRAKLVLVDRFDPQAVLDVIDDEAVSVLPLAPAAFAHWRTEEHLAERLGPARLVLSGSAPLPAEVAEDFVARTGVPVHQGYGLTEAAPVVTSTLVSADPRPGSVGAALPGVELRLIDVAGREVTGEDPGEIQVRGANLFSGYWPDGSDGPGPDGWWATGDVGLLDAAGDLSLVDRIKDLVIVSGFNVYPVEVEDVVAEVDGVSAVAVVGAPDELSGEAVVAYVVAPGRDPGEVDAAVRARCAQRLARFKRPNRVEVVEELPRTVTGKVQKGRLRGQERRRVLGLLE